MISLVSPILHPLCNLPVGVVCIPRCGSDTEAVNLLVPVTEPGSLAQAIEPFAFSLEVPL